LLGPSGKQFFDLPGWVASWEAGLRALREVQLAHSAAQLEQQWPPPQQQHSPLPHVVVTEAHSFAGY
jgi:hypothetical protein